MSHFDYIAQIAPGFEITAHTADCPVAAAENAEKQLYAIQFHPEVLHTVQGKEMLSNFVRNVCGCAGDWKMDEFVENSIKEIRAKVGDGKYCVHFPAVWILPWQQLCFQGNRKPAYLCIRRPWTSS